MMWSLLSGWVNSTMRYQSSRYTCVAWQKSGMVDEEEEEEEDEELKDKEGGC